MRSTMTGSGARGGHSFNAADVPDAVPWQERALSRPFGESPPEEDHLEHDVKEKGQALKRCRGRRWHLLPHGAAAFWRCGIVRPVHYLFSGDSNSNRCNETKKLPSIQFSTFLSTFLKATPLQKNCFRLINMNFLYLKNNYFQPWFISKVTMKSQT